MLFKATSKKKDQTYLLCNCEGTSDLLKFWVGDSNTMCGTLKFDSKDGCILLDYVVIKDAVDTTMELTFNHVKLVRVCGSIDNSF